MSLNQRISPSLSENPHKHQVPLSQSKGFTLLELMIVITILGIMVTIAVPKFQEWREHSAVNNTTTALFTTLKRARSLAFAESREIRVVLDVVNGRFTYDDDKGGLCLNCRPKVVDLAQFSPKPELIASGTLIKFSSQSTSSQGTIKIKKGTYFKCISVNLIGRAYINNDTQGCLNL